MKLEVGKKYKNRCGDTIFEIVSTHDGMNFKFVGVSPDRRTEFTADGHYFASGNEDRDDLVEEYIEPSKLVLQDGKKYKTRDGKRIVLISKNLDPHSDFEFRGVDIDNAYFFSTYRTSGSYYYDGKADDDDLVVEVETVEPPLIPPTLDSLIKQIEDLTGRKVQVILS